MRANVREGLGGEDGARVRRSVRMKTKIRVNKRGLTSGPDKVDVTTAKKTVALE